MKKQNPYKAVMPYQSEFSHRYACWANNHRGWAKMKKSHRRLAKHRLRREMKKEYDYEIQKPQDRGIV